MHYLCERETVRTLENPFLPKCKVYLTLPTFLYNKIAMQVHKPSTVVLNLDEMEEKNSLFQKKAKSSASFATDKKQFDSKDELSLALTDIPEGLDQITEEDASLNLDDSSSAGCSESAASSMHFSFMDDSSAAKDADNYPALYNPEKQLDYERKKIDDANKEKYGMFYILAPLFDYFAGGYAVVNQKLFCGA